MATATTDSTQLPPFPIHRFTVDQYHRMAEIGILTPEDHVELLEGWIVHKMNHRPAHGFVVRLLNDLLQRQLPAGWLCQCQLPITTERSEPEPDIAIVHGNHHDFRSRHPSGSECRLIVEVADTSILKDRAKAEIYFEAGVKEYWLINLVERRVERYVTSSGPEYSVSILSPEEWIILHIDDHEISFELKSIFE